MTTTYTPQPGRALVIHGPAASGKTKMATEIAAKRGSFQSLQSGHYFSTTLKDVLLTRPRTLIIEGEPSASNLAEIKNIVTNTQIAIRPPYTAEKVSVPAPLIIICTQDKPRWLSPDSRRFDVIELR